MAAYRVPLSLFASPHIVNMTRIQRAIRCKSAFHTRLVKKISNLEHVSSERQQQESQVKHIREQLTTSKNKVAQLMKETEEKWKTFESRKNKSLWKKAKTMFSEKEKHKDQEAER